MALTVNTELSALLAAAATKTEWTAILITALGATRRVVCKRNGTTFRDCALTGTMQASAGSITFAGYTSDTTTYLAADLSTGSSTLRIEGGGHWVEGTLGLAASGCDFILAANPTTSNGFAFGTLSIDAPAALPLGGTLATMTLVNTSGSAVASNFIAPMFGHPFAEGDIPAGHYPSFVVGGSTACPYTMWGKTTWPDGSLKFASFLMRVPTGITGSGTLEVEVTITGTAPASSSSRTLADLSSGSADLKVEITGLDNLTGTWVSSLNQGVTDNDDVVVYADGAVGKIWRIRQQFMNGGSNHGQMECYWYVAALQDSSGNLAGLRYLGRVTQPWYDIDSPAKTWRSFSSFLLKNGASTIRDHWANHQTPVSISFTYTGSFSDIRDYHITATAHGKETGSLIRYDGGTLPTGLSEGTSYFMTRVDANTIRTHSTPVGAINNEDAIAISGTASSTTFLTYPYITQFSSLMTCGADAKWDYLQAGGSIAADATVRIQQDADYWMGSLVLPKFETVTPDTQTSYDYEINSMGPIERNVGGTGERPDIGLMTGWHVKHLLSQRATDERVTRVVAMAGAQLPLMVYNSTNKTLPVVNNGSYSGMPAATSGMWWYGGDNVIGFTAPTGFRCTGMDVMGHDHMPALFYYPYVLTGEPQLLDLVTEMGVSAVLHRNPTSGTADSADMHGPRNNIVNGTTYYGATIGDPYQIREDAWATRDLGVAAALMPDTYPANIPYKTYLNDMLDSSFAKINNFNANVAPTYYREKGMVHFRTDNSAHLYDAWMHGYLQMTVAQVYRMTGKAAALTFLNHTVKWYEHIRATFGGWHVGHYECTARVSNVQGSAYITADSQLAFYGGHNFTWTASTDTITFGSQSNGWVPTNNDVVMWDAYEGNAPAGLTNFVPYYIINKSGSTFQLSTTQGGSAVDITADGGGGTAFIRDMTTPSASGNVDSNMSSTGIVANAKGATKLAQLAGATVSSDLLTDLNSRLSGVSYTSDPKYNFASS